MKLRPLMTCAALMTAPPFVEAQVAPATTTPPAAPSAAASAPAPRPAPPAAAAAAGGQGQQVQITGGRESDADQRRQSTAAKIVYGREEIERFGDSTLGEVLKRLPGVTVPGAPGRGGGPRLRGLGGGYTQILVDGQRAPAGFSIDQLPPDQVERIEIFRAPTAETGARAIGGTLNIVTREGFRARLNNLRLGVGHENGRTSPGVFWTHNDSRGDLIYNLATGVFKGGRKVEGTTIVSDEDIATGTEVRRQVERSLGDDSRIHANLTSRLEWRGPDGDSLMLNPALFATRGESRRRLQLEQPLGSTPPLYDHAASESDSSFSVARLNGQWRKRLDTGLRLQMNGGASLARGRGESERREFDAAGALLRLNEDDSRSRERSLNLNGKLSKLLEGDHSFVSGFELEDTQRTETRSNLQNGSPLLGEFGDNLEASSRRLALYAQDEWQLSRTWSGHAGLRWEGIRTEGDPGDGSRPGNRSSVFTPLLHALYKPDPRSRDQLRISLTRSYRSPTLANLVARPSVSSRYPVSGGNTPTSPDRAGNPELQPELATGIDVAVERYLPEGGVLSANVFARRLTDYIRSVTALETVAWSPVPRYVSRPVNVGDATTAGVELEAKFRLDQAFTGAPRVELRSNLSLYRSRVAGVPGPDNRLDQQPKATANLGADYRFRGTPLTLGASMNWTPAYRTQLADGESLQVSRKRLFDAYALWTFNPNLQLRLNATNIDPRDYLSTSVVEAGGLRERATTITPTYVSWRVGLEMKI